MFGGRATTHALALQRWLGQGIDARRRAAVCNNEARYSGRGRRDRCDKATEREIRDVVGGAATENKVWRKVKRRRMTLVHRVRVAAEDLERTQDAKRDDRVQARGRLMQPRAVRVNGERSGLVERLRDGSYVICDHTEGTVAEVSERRNAGPHQEQSELQHPCGRGWSRADGTDRDQQDTNHVRVAGSTC